MKLSKKQKEIIKTIREKGEYKIPATISHQNQTIKKLISIGVCEWNDTFNALILTELGKTIEL